MFTAFPYYPKKSQPKMRDLSCYGTSSSISILYDSSSCPIVFISRRSSLRGSIHLLSVSIHHNCPATHEDCMQYSSINSVDRRVCKSVHHHTFKQINQPDASNSHIYCSSFKYSSTCFGHPHAHHQELINCSSPLRFTVGTWW